LHAVLMKQTSICSASRATEFVENQSSPNSVQFFLSMCILHVLTLLRMHTVDQTANFCPA
jgi:hypothetical protein